jgi:hypothetical protein
MSDIRTIGQLRKTLRGLPDEMPVMLAIETRFSYTEDPIVMADLVGAEECVGNDGVRRLYLDGSQDQMLAEVGPECAACGLSGIAGLAHSCGKIVPVCEACEREKKLNRKLDDQSEHTCKRAP